MASILGLSTAVIDGVAVGPIAGQTFRTIGLPNFRPATYGLAIINPGPSNETYNGYIFPLSPESVRKEYTAMSNFYDVAAQAGTPGTGVQRIVDVFGNSPVIYTIQGTTGWQWHSKDAFTSTGLESIQALETLLNQYAALNFVKQTNNDPNLFTLEFADFFRNEFWQVEPIGPQGVMQDAQQPLLVRYNFRLVGVRNLAAPLLPAQSDPIAQAFATTSSQAATNLNATLDSTIVDYTNLTQAVT